MRFIPFFLFCTLALLSCEDDSELRLVTAHSWLLTENAGETQLWICNQEANIPLSWENLAQNVQDISSDNEYLWLVKGKNLLKYTAAGELKGTFSADSFVAHYLCAGEKYVFLSDTLQHKIAYFSKKKEEFVIQNVDSLPRKAVWINGRFFVPTGKNGVEIWNGDAMAMQKRFSVTHPVEELQKQQQSVSAFSPYTNLRRRTDINAISLLPDYTSRVDSSRKKYYSPYLKSDAGTETLGSVWLQRDKISTSQGEILGDSIQDFRFDFFSSAAWVINSKDSLYFLQTSTNSKKGLFSASKILGLETFQLVE